MNPDRFNCRTLEQNPRGEAIRRVMTAALEAVDPYQAVRKHMRLEDSRLWIGQQEYNLDDFQRVIVVGAGKAGSPVAQAVVEVLGERVETGLVITKHGHIQPGHDLGRVELAEAGHPVPDERGVVHTRRMMDLLRGAGAQDLVICLISGGGSALMTAPVPGVSLEDLRILTGLLLRSGATINQVNTLRKHLDEIKGGGLLRLADPARVAALILSDVVGDPLDVIASGPTVADPTRYMDALEILKGFDLPGQVPAPILQVLEEGARGERPETVKPGDPWLGLVQNLVIGSNLQAAQAACGQAEREGYHTLLLTTYLQGEASQAGRFLAALARQQASGQSSLPRPSCILLGGETTVTVRGEGLGGRNQELALGAVVEMAGLEGVTLASLASDGGDGPTDAAGAVVSGATQARAAALGLDPAASLRANDAYHFFEPLGDLLRPGPTHTNVNDLAFLFVE